MNRFTLTVGLALAAGVGVAGADTVTLNFDGLAGGSSATTVRLATRTLAAGHLNYTVVAGAPAGSLSTFCIDLDQFVASGEVVYDVADITDAPVPGTSTYSQAQADQVSAILANAAQLGWIDGRLQADSNQTDYLARMGAIQAAIWEALGETLDLNSGDTTPALHAAYDVLMDAQTFDGSLRLAGLRALISEDSQDLLYVVPLPPAAFAGAGLLAACFGVRAARRR
jgi:hypothetical protein